MRQTMRWIAVLLLPALMATGSLVGAPKKPTDKDKDAEKTTDKMIKAGTLVGKVMAVYEDKRKIRLQVTIQELNPAGLQQLATAQRNLAMARDRAAYAAAQNGVLQAQGNLYKSTPKEVEIQALDDVVVRMARPKDDYDEKGKRKRYTRKELAEMRGPDKKLPGFTAEFGDVATEQIIQVSLVRKKGLPALPKPRRRKARDKDEGAEADLLADYAPQASMILIVREPAPSR